jgi:hypothetical protein
MPSTFKVQAEGRHDTQHNDTHRKGIQHNNNAQDNDTQHDGRILSCWVLSLLGH